MRFWRVTWNNGRSWTDIEGDYDTDRFMDGLAARGHECEATLIERTFTNSRYDHYTSFAGYHLGLS